MGRTNTVWCRAGGCVCIFSHECRHFCSDNGYLSPGQRKRGAWIKAPLFKGLNTEKRPFMAHFESNKQTQKCYVTEWVKRNAVIKQRLCLCAAHKRTISPDLFPSVPVWWTVNVAIVKLTASFSGAGHRVRRLVEAGHGFQTNPTAVLGQELCKECHLAGHFYHHFLWL